MGRLTFQTSAGARPGPEHGPSTPRPPLRRAETSGSTIPFPAVISDVPGEHPRQFRAGPDKRRHPASPNRPEAVDIRTIQAPSRLFLLECCAFHCCLCGVNAPEPFFSWRAPSFPTIVAISVNIRNQLMLFQPNIICQNLPPICIAAHSRQVRPSPVFVSKEP